MNFIVVIFFVMTSICVSQSDSELIGSDFDREQLIKDFEKRKDGFFPCVYDGTYCNMREEICSVKTKTCHRIFNIPEGTSYSEEQKDKECLEIIKGNTHGKIEGVNDVCFYRLGYRLYCSNCSELDGGLISTDKMRSNYKTGKEFCPYDMSYCQRDKEICSKEKRSCKAVLEASASEESKRLYCEEVLKSKQETVEGLKDVCRYYIGTLVASGKICLRNCDRDSGSSSSIIGKAVGISIGVITMVVIVALVVGLLLAKKKKKWCFSESSETPIPGNGRNPTGSGPPTQDSNSSAAVDDVNLRVGLTGGDPTDIHNRCKRTGSGHDDEDSTTEAPDSRPMLNVNPRGETRQ